ncbi:hypothetical protein LSH36_156g00065 [Paralvinella palmiformis]|uniref:Sulfatase N-terminal domain-containing protein n=1 Tax=Paralvinella palmiformis TaxID=53620 RepID=A0AAD9JU50_9ANNE|nr:hypothetical protein LSH36_156g00065 [Paralvinella palmiformis]
MRISKVIKLLWGTTAVVIGVLTYSSLTTLERRSKKFLPPDTELNTGVDGFPIKFVNFLSEPPTRDSHKNVLFLMSDDLRVQLGAYDRHNPRRILTTITPNLDRLANRSLVLERAYVQLSMCGPSRTSILTGRRPDTTRVWSQKEYWRKVGGNFTTLPQYFKENGYITANVGKVFHPRKASGKDDPMSWTEPIYQPPDKKFWRTLADSWRAFTEKELSETPHPDQLIAEEAIRKLRELAPEVQRGRRFFLGVGFLKPHLPFTFPERFLNLYPPDEMDVPRNPYVPQHYPELAYNRPTELLNRRDIARLDWSGEMNETIGTQYTMKLRRAYFSCVSFVDEKVGEILAVLDELGLAKNTVVSFIGDHGWHLGENGRWGKHTNMEEGTRSPMMIHLPGRTQHGISSGSIVEFVDLFPTVAEAAGLDGVPPCPKDSSTTQLCTEGTSLLPLIEDPEAILKHGAYSQHRLYRNTGMGYSVRTDRFRYTEWVPVESTRNQNRTYDYEIVWDRCYAAELYDHRTDPEENVNRAHDRKYQGFREELKKRLREKIGSVIKNVVIPL